MIVGESRRWDDLMVQQVSVDGRCGKSWEIKLESGKKISTDGVMEMMERERRMEGDGESSE